MFASCSHRLRGPSPVSSVRSSLDLGTPTQIYTPENLPLLRCTDPDCGHTWFERARLAEGADCIECGSPTVVVGREEDEGWDDAPVIPGRPSREDGPRLSHARERARALLKEHGIHSVPVPVRGIARREGLEIKDDVALGKLRARVVGSVIELASGDGEYVKRFSIAHELGHWILGTRHGDGPHIEAEANAFAGELLVPGSRLLVALRETTEISELSRVFQVSHSVIRIAAETHKKGALLR